MRLATVLTPLNETNLQLAAQCGVTDLVTRYPAKTSELSRIQELAGRFGMNVAVIEGYLPIEQLKLGTDDGSELQAMKDLLRMMGDAGVKLLCYNFMSGTDWVRTRTDVPARGGATVTQFRLQDVARAQSLNGSVPMPDSSITADELWQNLDRFLTELLPIAERAGVTLAMHPDDPPLAELMGRGRIMCTVESFERLVQNWSSAANRICFCQGTFAAMGVDIPATIRRLGAHIAYVHCRDTRGTPDDFVETFHDDGPTDMVAAMRAYREIGFDGPLRPDHVPVLAGEEGEPGYTMLGRLYAFGYLRGLMQATERSGRIGSE
ncbi:Mannonate dehydratase [Maioricimonas rarisocia]|uniref:mannonate dehydratase n=1 Tax=Maioricimonas rarisocia TaxID=2528026 RepID=A0A517Z9D7_9PLAN|nr:mannonate dehydratase [Maioricimonas rarisocia]QDU39083.1 Mannonate dehydratase [Maioricimonas rarisocia]